MTRYASLADFVTVSTDAYEAVREVLLEDADQPPDPGRDVGVEQGTLLQAIVAVGSGDARLFAPLVPAAERQVAEIDRTSPAKVQPNLSVLNVLSELQLMGVAVPEETVRTATGWLAGMRTAGMEPRWMHWNRGLAALAMGDLPTARTIAALPADGSGEADPDVSPGYSIQAWFALFVVAVERRLPWSAMRPRWEEYLTELPGFIEVGEQSAVDLAWAGRIVGHMVAGVPLGEVADWIHTQVHRVASAGA
jgi:hypothetical protein